MKYHENTLKYKFRDTDDIGEDDYDIEGESYRELIDICCQYCSVVSFDLYPQWADAEYLMQIQQHLIKRDNTYRRVVKEFGSYVTGSDKRYYTVCAEMCELLKKGNNIKNLVDFSYEDAIKYITEKYQTTRDIASKVLQKPISYLTKEHLQEMLDLQNDIKALEEDDRDIFEFLIKKYKDLKKLIAKELNKND